MHIVLTVNAAWNIINFRKPLVAALISDGHRITVLAPPDDSVGELKAMGCDFIKINMNKMGMNPLSELKLLWTIYRTLGHIEPDAILSFTIKNNLYCSISARFLGIPIIPNVTGLGTAFLSSGPMRKLIELMYRISFRTCPYVIFQNEDDLALFVKNGLVHKDQARLVPGSGIDLGHFAPAPYPNDMDNVIFLLVARMLRDKGVSEFVEAAQSVRTQYPSARFQLLGATDYDNRSAFDAETVDGWHRSGAVEYLGTASDVRIPMRNAHCIVLPSYREGAPRTLIEGSALARPSIATDVPGCRSVVEDQITGFLCKPRDSADLASAMTQFLALSNRVREKMGIAAHARIERLYSVDRVIVVYRRLLKDVALPSTEA